MSQVYDEPIVVRLTQPVGPYPVGTEFGFKDVADAIRALGSSAYFTVVRTQDGDPIPPPTPEDLTEAERQALARARAARLIRGGEFDPLVPGPGEVIVGGADGPVATPVEEIGGDPNAVIGTGVRRIIASYDPNHPLEDGDLLVLLQAETFFTDFSTQTTGQAPANWSKIWGGASTWTVADDESATGGKVLRAVSPANGRHALAWNRADVVAASATTPSQEVVFKWKAAATTARPRALLQGAGAQGAETGYTPGYFSTTEIRNVRYSSGASDSPAITTGPTLVADVWTIMRARVDHGKQTLSLKIWKADDPEPDTWVITDSPAVASSPGLPGLVLWAGQVDIDWVGVSFGGIAPMEG